MKAPKPNYPTVLYPKLPVLLAGDMVFWLMPQLEKGGMTMLTDVGPPASKVEMGGRGIDIIMMEWQEVLFLL